MAAAVGHPDVDLRVGIHIAAAQGENGSVVVMGLNNGIEDALELRGPGWLNSKAACRGREIRAGRWRRDRWRQRLPGGTKDCETISGGARHRRRLWGRWNSD